MPAMNPAATIVVVNARFIVALRLFDRGQLRVLDLDHFCISQHHVIGVASALCRNEHDNELTTPLQACALRSAARQIRRGSSKVSMLGCALGSITKNRAS
jgi:hypothetical protein